MNGKGRNAIIITTMAAIWPFGLRVETSACVPVRLGRQGRDLRQRDVGRVGHVLACGVHGGFHGGREFAERVGPGPGLEFVQVERHLLVPVGLSGRQVAASCGLGLGCWRPFLAGGSRVFLHGAGVSTIGAASAFSVRSASLRVLGSIPGGSTRTRSVEPYSFSRIGSRLNINSRVANAALVFCLCSKQDFKTKDRACASRCFRAARHTKKTSRAQVRAEKWCRVQLPHK